MIGSGSGSGIGGSRVNVIGSLDAIGNVVVDVIENWTFAFDLNSHPRLEFRPGFKLIALPFKLVKNHAKSSG